MNPTTRRVRRLAASVTFAAVAGGLALPLLATPAGAVQETDTSRLQGQDRYGTAAVVALDTFPDGAGSVVLATGQTFADALAANGLAGALGAPILLTTTAELPEVTEEALTTLGPDTVYVMGGTAAVSQAVEDGLAGDYDIERVEGQNRWETAAAAGAAIDATDDSIPATTDDGLGSTSDGITAVLANGLNFPDAVSAGPVAFAGRLPVLLTEAGRIPDATSTALEDLGIEHVLLIGGTTVINDSIETALEADGYTTERLAGGDRWATNVEVNDYATAELGFGGVTAYLSTGLKFPDSLAGGPLAGTSAAPLVLTAPTTLPGAAGSYLATNANAIDEIIAIGGPAAVSDATLADAAEAAQLSTNRAFVITPTESATQPLSTLFLTSEGARTFEVSGLEPGGSYVIALLDAETVDPTGGVSFDAYSLSDEAATSIESINGTPTGAAGGIETVQEDATATEDGTLTVVVDATEPDSIFPLVFEDLDGNGDLTLAGDVADEPFGLGGKTTWLPAEAADDTYEGVTVTALSLDDNYFVAGGDTFLYGTTDRFRGDTPTAESATITPGQFEGMLSVGDVLDIEYFRDAQALFDVVTDDIPDIDDVTASTPSVSDPNLVQVSWVPSEQADVVYSVYRDDGDGTFDDGDAIVSAAGASTTRSFVEPSSTAGVRYIVVPEGGTSGTPDTLDDDGDAVTFLSNEIVPGVTLFGLTNGTTVSENAGLALLNAGDQFMLHFSRDVQVASNASITVRRGTGNQVTLTNGTATSSWAVDGGTITITLGSGADAAPDIAYGEETMVTALSGVRDVGGTTVPVTALRDRVLENDGPELMVESTTCDVGDTTCTIAFNEPVGGSAANRSSYDYRPEPAGKFLTGITLGDDGRTITLTFAPGVGADDRIRPRTELAAVSDDDGQASTQALFDFVR
ncbi:cell wall-binding repeat-containing protein [Acidimicrobiia bacterium EGI L10123]|uniref:cell wall-binding repeat-containing protein n=1 Tax=Salinilacustrithrix flava TaxID=2957203 RepID=UPI003D7C2032|nr:cell wall-binding repeat-containing protein [Acidimicrobiia bacterium EGI L10123]